VTVTGNTISGTDAGNYTLVQQSGLTANITAKPLTITGFLADDKAYDGTTTAVVNTPGTLTGVIGGEVVTFTYSGAAFNSKDVATANTVTLNGVTLGGSGDEANYSYSGPTTDASVITAVEEEVPVIRYIAPVVDDFVLTTGAPTTTVPPVGGTSTPLVTAPPDPGGSTASSLGMSPASLGIESVASVGSSGSTGSTGGAGLTGGSTGSSFGGGSSAGSNLSDMNSGYLASTGTLGGTTQAASGGGTTTTSDISQASMPVNSFSPGRVSGGRVDGVINLYLGGKLVRQTSNAVIPLPDDVRTGITSSAGTERVTLLNGSPLPSWLRYDSRTQTFKIITLPSATFHIKLRVQDKNRSWVVDITSTKSSA